MFTQTTVRVFSVLLFTLGLQSAQASQSLEANISTDRPSQILSSTDLQYEPIYEQVPYEDTCSREVLSHYTRVCDSSGSSGNDWGSGGGGGGGGSSCHTSNDTVCNSHGCTTVPRRSCDKSVKSAASANTCYDNPVYTTEYYPCTRYRTEVVGQRLVKTYKNEIEVVLAQPEEFKGADVKVKVNVQYDNASAELISSFPKAVVIANVRTISASDLGAEKHSKIQVLIDATLSAELVKKIHLVNIQDLKLGFRKVSFMVAEAADLQDLLSSSLELVQVRKVIRDKEIYSGGVSKAAFKTEKIGNALKAEIDFNALNISVKSKKSHDVSVELGMQIPQIINAKDFAVELAKKPSASIQGVRPQ